MGSFRLGAVLVCISLARSHVSPEPGLRDPLSALASSKGLQDPEPTHSDKAPAPTPTPQPEKRPHKASPTPAPKPAPTPAPEPTPPHSEKSAPSVAAKEASGPSPAHSEHASSPANTSKPAPASSKSKHHAPTSPENAAQGPDAGAVPAPAPQPIPIYDSPMPVPSPTPSDFQDGASPSPTPSPTPVYPPIMTVEPLMTTEPLTTSPPASATPAPPVPTTMAWQEEAGLATAGTVGVAAMIGAIVDSIPGVVGSVSTTTTTTRTSFVIAARLHVDEAAAYEPPSKRVLRGNLELIGASGLGLFVVFGCCMLGVRHFCCSSNKPARSMSRGDSLESEESFDQEDFDDGMVGCNACGARLDPSATRCHNCGLVRFPKRQASNNENKPLLP